MKSESGFSLGKGSKNKMGIFNGICQEGWEGASGAINVFFNFFAYKLSTITPRLPKRVLHLVWALNNVFVVVKVTMNMAEYGTWQSQRISILNQL